MANLNSVLKSEISRIARKEIKSAAEPIRKANAAHRREIASLKKLVADLQRELKNAQRVAARSKPDVASADDVVEARISAKGIKTLRERLGLSAAELGLLTGASSQSVYNWEAGTQPRPAQRAALVALRNVGKREVRRRLDEMAVEA